jgi:hypothetical protein
MSELTFPGPVGRGATGRPARQVQEWLCLHQLRVVVDGEFGKATEAAVREFQARMGLPVSGGVDQLTFEALVAPMRAALATIQPVPGDLSQVLVAYARQHLAQSPREVGGQNRGPWVRLYMKGKEGGDAPWCAGFVSSLLQQACTVLGRAAPLPWTASCDMLAGHAKKGKRFVKEAEAAKSQLQPGAFFLNRKKPGDWDHTGMVIEFGADSFRTIEGNTNDAGHREGYEVCTRIRGYPNKDFVRID